MPGGDKASQEPWRSAAALCWQARKTNYTESSPLLYAAWKKKINCPQSSSVGRLFDAAAALLNVADSYSFEGQAPMLLEALANGGDAEAIELPLKQDDQAIWCIDWQPLLDYLLDGSASAKNKAYCFHQSLALALLEQAKIFRELYKIDVVGLSGGVFQNQLLSQMTFSLLEEHHIKVFLGKKIPVNDAGISYGQIIEYAATA